MDQLATIMDSVYTRGTVFGRANFAEPWSVFTRGAPFAIFHAILRGRCRIVHEGTELALNTGDVVILPRGAPHTMCSDTGVRSVPIRDLFGEEDEDGVGRATHGGDGPVTEIICGTFRFDERLPNPLLNALPEVVRVDWDASRARLEATLHLIEAEIADRRPGGGVVIARLTDALFVQVVRSLLEDPTYAALPWLAALSDDRIARALAAIHRDPGGDWTAAALAREAHMSRTAFYARFDELVGESPASYLLRRRMEGACYALRNTDASVAEVAALSGYRSESSFSKAFKRWTGAAPGVYRDAQDSA